MKTTGMGRNRMEAFSDGVIAIIITIMVLELKVPHEPTFAALTEVWPVFLSYVLSFMYVGIYWLNHHHLLHTVTRVSGGILWANLQLLFWLSLVPFVTGWMGENHFAPFPTAVYGFIMLMAGAAYAVLQHCIVHVDGEDSLLRRAIGQDWKAKVSIIAYVLGVVAARWLPSLSICLYFAVALMWLVPDRRIERALGGE